MTVNPPLVSIGLPTYNRAERLPRALQSALAQDYPHLEIVVSDNASKDQTQTICEDFARRDSRLRYIRQNINRGMTANYAEVLKEAKGDFFMWLSDDDWISPGYVSGCVKALLTEPDFVGVAGKARLIRRDLTVLEEKEIHLLENSGGQRLLSYYRQVETNSIFYCVFRKEQVRKARWQHVFAGDWLLMAEMAFMGKIKISGAGHIERSADGISSDMEKLALQFGMPAAKAKNPWPGLAAVVFKEIGWVSPSFAALKWPARLYLGARAFLIVWRRWCLLPPWFLKWGVGPARRVRALQARILKKFKP